MAKVQDKIDKKMNHFIMTLVGNGIFLLILGVLIVWTDFMLQLVMGLVTILVAYVFFYTAYKVNQLKEHIDKIVKF